MQGQAAKGNALLIIIIVLFAIHFMAFTFGQPPAWLQLTGVAGVILFVIRIARGDD